MQKLYRQSLEILRNIVLIPKSVDVKEDDLTMRYYAIDRSPEYLAHYGIRGMKWGVRKAIESGNGARLNRHAAKAAAKLRRLAANASIIQQGAAYKENKEAAKFGAGIAGLGAGAGLLAYGTGHFNGRTAGPLGGITGAGLGMAAGYGTQALIAKHRLKSKGHAKAVQKVRDWQDNMNEAFKGTKYSKLAGKKYGDNYQISKVMINPKNGNLERKIVTIKGDQLTMDYAGKIKPSKIDTETLIKFKKSRSKR